MSNLIFSRRATKGFIDELKAVLPAGALRGVVGRLNNHKADRLAAMWEIVILSVLSQIGEISSEPVLSNGRRPDFKLEFGTTTVFGDVTTVSDFGLHLANPSDFLLAEIVRLAKKYRLNPNHFRLDIRGERRGNPNKVRMHLKLPRRSVLATVINGEVKPFIVSLTSAPSQGLSRQFRDQDYDFVISYQPKNLFLTSSHPSYTAAFSIAQNAVYQRLEEKYKQLVGAPDDALRTIVLCDGGCDTFHTARSPGNFNVTEIAKAFLRQHLLIDFLLLVTVEEVTYPLNERRCDLKYLILPNEGRLAQRPEIRAIFSTLSTNLHMSFKRLPSPIQNPYTASQRARESGVGPDMIGGYSMSAHRVRLSARALQRLLAGEVSFEQFVQAHDWALDGKGPTNPFKAALDRHEMLSASQVETARDRDDNWIEFQFSKDAAVGPFEV